MDTQCIEGVPDAIPAIASAGDTLQRRDRFTPYVDGRMWSLHRFPFKHHRIELVKIPLVRDHRTHYPESGLPVQLQMDVPTFMAIHTCSASTLY